MRVDSSQQRIRRNRPGVITITCFGPVAAAAWSGALVVVDAELSCDEGCLDRTVLAAHVPLHVPALRSRAALRLFVATHLASTQDAVLKAVRLRLAARWAASTAPWRAYRAAASICDRTSPSGPQQLALFTPRPGRRAMTTDDGPGDVSCVRSSLHERIDVTMILLREGQGHLCDARA